MNSEEILSMDSYILYSWINTKLRDEFESLDDLCEFYQVDREKVESKLKSIGFVYLRESNQFKSNG